MHRLSVMSLAALLIVGGVLAFVVFVSPHVSTAAASNQPSGSNPATGPAGTGTNSTLLTPPPASTGSTDDDGTGFDS